MSDQSIESAMQENRVFPPPPEVSAKAWIKSRQQYDQMYRESIDRPDDFWGKIAGELHWFKKWDRVLEWNLPNAKWFVGGKTNVAYNCLDFQIEKGRGEKIAILWEGENGDVRRVTYRQLREDVCRLANGLKKLGVKKGTRVTIYMPMVPEAAVAMLACARLGAPHSVIFGGFSSQAIADRVDDAKSEIVITADGGRRRGQLVPLKHNVDEAAKKTALIKKVIVFKHTAEPIGWTEGRDVWWSDVVAGQSAACDAEPLDAEDPLFVLYTSGSTGKPKGIVHTTGGFLVGTYITTKYVFDLHDQDIYWCTADVGWITGHSYVVYGPLANGTTSLMYEGAPNFPDFSRFWAIIARHKVTVFYTAPTAIRAFMRAGRQLVDGHDLSSLRILGTVGEPINPEAWMWYHRVIGGERCPIVDTWWQTETGATMMAPIPGVTATKPGSCTKPLPGIFADIVDEDGRPVKTADAGGYLVIKRPWPSMLRTIWGDNERYIKTYWEKFKNHYYVAGDSARRDKDGYYWIMGRIDDVLNIAGHRLGTMEIESALVAHPKVAEAAVVSKPHDIKGESAFAYVVLNVPRPQGAAAKALIDELRAWVGDQLSPIAKPDEIRLTDNLPKTRSGKIMRRLLRAVA
ncbi:MAG TPA: acetate--CoA ligase, partial [Tepidisphaeraceae bacterium]|nr:acetate--CoA ligase [Tepidisphaeraceae bacterium]